MAMCEAAQQLLEDPYLELFNNLKKVIYKQVTDTEPRQGQYREAVIYQIDHGTGHLNRVCQNMAVLLNAAKKDSLSSEDYFVALCSAAFHDLGMHFGWELLTPPIYETPSIDETTIIREKHAWIGGEWFRSICLDTPPDILLDDLTARQLRLL
jgi:hypothetical protein